MKDENKPPDKTSTKHVMENFKEFAGIKNKASNIKIEGLIFNKQIFRRWKRLLIVCHILI